MGKKRRDDPGGIRAYIFVLPVITIIAMLHVIIITLIMAINTSSSMLSATMQNSGSYIEEATSILAGSSLLAETSGNFVLVPLTESGEVNEFPLRAYANELETGRRGYQVAERFRDYDVSAEVLEKIGLAADAAADLMQTQLHALALMTSVYPLKDGSLKARIPMPELSRQEQAMSGEQKIGLAHRLIQSSDYAQNKQTVSENINTCSGMIKEAMGRHAAAEAARVMFLRRLLWAFTLMIIAILIVTFFILHRQVIRPLVDYTHLINSENLLDEKTGFAEVRRLAAAYNRLLRRRDALDGILRSAAETDALTNLPNRYSYEHYILELQDGSHAIALLLFDVNYLKVTNDTFGHAAGDALLRSSAECILSCFGSPREHNCFRFGGDEFAAVVKDTSSEEIKRMVEHFREDQKKREISIACGCAYTNDIGETTFKSMMEQADRDMYEQKKMLHVQRDFYNRTKNVCPV